MYCNKYFLKTCLVLKIIFFKSLVQNTRAKELPRITNVFANDNWFSGFSDSANGLELCRERFVG